MGLSDNRVAVIRRGLAAFDSRERTAFTACFAPDVTMDRGDTNEHAGHLALASCFDWVVARFADARLVLLRAQGLDKDACIIECLLTGTDATDRVVCASYGALLTFDSDDRVTRVALRGDTATLSADTPPLETGTVDEAGIRRLAGKQTEAWSSGDPARVAANYAETGWIIINGAPPWAGRAGLAAMAGGFMASYPDLAMSMESLHIAGDRAVWSWRLRGTNSGPGGTGQPVDFSGYEVWRIDDDGLIAESYGYYDSAAYAHQVEHGVGQVT